MPMRKYINIVSESMLTEAPDYRGMFNKFDIEEGSNTSQVINDIILWSRKNLKKNDRIVWMLNRVKEDLSLVKEEDAKGKVFYNPVDLKALFGRRLNWLEHYLSLPIDAIQRHVFAANMSDDDLHGLFRAMERKWQEGRAEYVPMDEHDRIIMSFPDGFSWVQLDRESCHLEGNAMGHCGNTASPKVGQTILSLRKKIKDGSQEMWRPSLTFILNKDGTLGEMKGRANNKPNAKYHPHIVKLLLSDMITGVRGGGHAPEQNFSLDDLDHKTARELREAKPQLWETPVTNDPHELADIVEAAYQIVVQNDTVNDEEVISVYNGSVTRIDEDLYRQSHLFDRWHWVAIGRRSLNDMVQGGILDHEQVESVMNSLNNHTQSKIVDYINDEYEGEVQEYMEDHGYEKDEDDDKYVADIDVITRMITDNYSSWFERAHDAIYEAVIESGEKEFLEDAVRNVVGVLRSGTSTNEEGLEITMELEDGEIEGFGDRHIRIYIQLTERNIAIINELQNDDSFTFYDFDYGCDDIQDEGEMPIEDAEQYFNYRDAAAELENSYFGKM